MSAHTASQLKRTPLFENHVNRQAKVVDFSGWEMPLQYGKVLEEHKAVRSAAGLFDIAHMGLVLLTGGSADETLAFLDGLVPQDLTRLYPGKAVYTQFLNEQGGIIDDIIVYRLPENLSSSDFPGFTQVLVICNAGNTERDLAWLQQHARQHESPVEVTFASRDFSLLALQGPRFASVLSALSLTPDALPERFHVSAHQLDGVPVLLARTGYTGEDGVEIIVANRHVDTLWNRLLEAGAPVGLSPIGLAARDTLRLEAAYPLHGHDISEADTPLEAGLGWSVKLAKPRPFIGQAALLRQKAEGVAKRFYCFKIQKRAIARQHDPIEVDGRRVGEVTSGSISPLTNEAIAMGYIDGALSLAPGDAVTIIVRNQPVAALIVERPFYKKS